MNLGFIHKLYISLCDNILIINRSLFDNSRKYCEEIKEEALMGD